MKVLLISHNPICTYDNMGKTLLSLFSGFKKEELCQLFIHPARPDTDICDSYYRISDREALKSIFSPFRQIGEIVEVETDPAMNGRTGSIMINRSETAEDLLFMLRDFVWKHSHWHNGKLVNWLKEQRPDAVFVAPGSSKFIYDIAIRISEDLNIPVITYICDDFYFQEGNLNLIRRIHRTLLRKKTDRLLERSSHLIVISDELKQRYSQICSIPVSVIMTGAAIDRNSEIKKGTVDNISYFGNLSLNRYKNLAMIGRSLDRINAEDGRHLELNIYAGDADSIMLDEFQSISSLNMNGFVSGEEYLHAFRKSDVLVHVESFDKEYMERVRYSVSTKIADSLASGILLFAFGPKGLASIDYLESNSCAWLVEDPSELDASIREMVENQNKREEIELTALGIAADNHDSLTNSRAIRKIIKSVL